MEELTTVSDVNDEARHQSQVVILEVEEGRSDGHGMLPRHRVIWLNADDRHSQASAQALLKAASSIT